MTHFRLIQQAYLELTLVYLYNSRGIQVKDGSHLDRSTCVCVMCDLFQTDPAGIPRAGPGLPVQQWGDTGEGWVLPGVCDRGQWG